MQLPSRLFATAALAVGMLAASASAEKSKVNGWYPCSYSEAGSSGNATDFASMTIFDCAEIQVPLCYDGVCQSDRLINFFVKRLVAKNPPPEGTPRKALIAIQGGPGAASSAMEGTLATMLDLLGNTVDYYTFDHRGTGRTEFLLCDAAQSLTAGSPDGTSLSLEELNTCFQDLNYQYDDQAAAFGTTSAAMDVRTMINTFLSEHQVYVYGFSYGTYLTQRILQLDIPQVKGYIFDGVDVLTTNDDPLESANSHWNQAIHAPSRRMLEYCFDDPNCLFKFKSRETVLEDVIEFMNQLDAQVDTNKCAQLLMKDSKYPQPSVELRTQLSGLVKTLETRVAALQTLGRVQRCNEEDIKALTTLPADVAEARAILARASMPDPISDDSPLLYDVIVLSERWSVPPPNKTERDSFFMGGPFSMDDSDLAYMYCVFTGSNDTACTEIQDKLPPINATFKYEHDQYRAKPLVLPEYANALVINGGLDMATPLEFGELLYTKLRTSSPNSNVMMVNFDYGIHCNGEGVPEKPETPCRDAIVAAFVEHDGDASVIDTSCMESLPSTKFA